MTAANFTTWFRGTHLRDGNVLVAANAFAAEWLRTKYLRAIQDALGAPVVYVVGPGESVVASEPVVMGGMQPVAMFPSEPIPTLAETVATLVRAAVGFAVATGLPASRVWATLVEGAS
jgi:chromosomal replication initiation ATPase DnaA